MPSPPRRRRPALTALAVLLIVGGAALAGLLAVRMDSREPVVVVSQQINVGEQITEDMLQPRNVSGDGLPVIRWDQRKQIIGDAYARQTIYPGQLLQIDLLRSDPPLELDQAQVGVPLTSGKFPSGLRSGDAVRLVRIGDTQRPVGSALHRPGDRGRPGRQVVRLRQRREGVGRHGHRAAERGRRRRRRDRHRRARHRP